MTTDYEDTLIRALRENVITDHEKKLIRTLCKNDLAVTKTAKDLSYHRNSIVYQIKNIKKKTGYDPTTFYGAVALLRLIEEE